jgi:hypothetical protein
MEYEVHKALALTEAVTGKVLNYRQLMQSQKKKKHGVIRQQTNLEG